VTTWPSGITSPGITEAVIVPDSQLRYLTVSRITFDRTMNVRRGFQLTLHRRKGIIRVVVRHRRETPRRSAMHAAYAARRRRRTR
jgi:hypothetical protein